MLQCSETINSSTPGKTQLPSQPSTQLAAFCQMLDPETEIRTPDGMPRLAPNSALWEDYYHESVPAWIVSDTPSTSDVVVATFDDRIARQGRTAVFDLGSGKVIKYSRFCPYISKDFETRVDTLLLESYFLELLNDTGIANRIYYYSRAGVMPMPGAWTRLGLPKLDLKWCEDDSAPVVRYMISEKIQMDMCEFAKTLGPAKFTHSVRVGIATINLLERLHSHDIIHGDIHCGNVALSADGSRHVLIDFGRASIINAELDKTHPSYRAPSPVSVAAIEPDVELGCHMYDTPWEMLGMKRSFRDDIFRVFRMMAGIVYGPKTAVYLYDLCEGFSEADTSEFIRLQTSANPLDFESESEWHGRVRNLLVDALKSEPEEMRRQKDIIAERFAQLIYHVRQLGPMAKPDYLMIIQGLNSIIDLAAVDI
jgi:serine/threonine protein kinase